MRGYGDQSRPWSCVSACVRVRALEDKRLELSTPNLVDVPAARRAYFDHKVKGQGHPVIKRVAGVGLQVDMTA